ncbi:hypothetical protein PIB30_064258 [Stylosanthes scabra]|uniref:Uncharacterized protein n=1 Tax=Stylosanthes scabra TaxID=79078 RepID=A0ABU6XML5_9FABA|nr:hypothetical protein [Stylosanthes scabra]
MQLAIGFVARGLSFALSTFKKKVSHGCNQVKIPSTRLGSFSLRSRNKSLIVENKAQIKQSKNNNDKRMPMITANPKLDELSLRRNKLPQGGGINPCPHILGIHNCEDIDLTIDSSKPRVTGINSPAVHAWRESADNT